MLLPPPAGRTRHRRLIPAARTTPKNRCRNEPSDATFEGNLHATKKQSVNRCFT
jgi:hypothetical protein